MRRLSFIVAILSLFILLFLLALPPKPITSPDNLSQFQPNQKLLIQGEVIKETLAKNYKILYLDSEFQLECPLPCPSYLNKNISAISLLQFYNGRYYLRILKIKKFLSFYPAL